MKKYSIIIAAAAICLLTACSKEKELRAPEEEQNIAEEVLPANCISAVIGEVATSASVDDATAAFSWNTGDKIAVWSGSSYQISDALASTYDGSNSAIFSFGSDINAGRADFAVFPASLVSSGSSASAHTAESLKITLPSSYTLNQVQGEVSPTPLIAVNAPGATLAFKSVCALLRLDVHCIAKDAEYLKISFPGKKVNGEFTLTNFVAGTDGVQGSASSDEEEETITIEELGTAGHFIDSLIVNIPLPMGSYDNVKIAAYDSYSARINYIVAPIKLVESVPTAWTPGRKASRKLKAYLPVFTTYAADSAETLIHGYVGVNKRAVVISPGNLQAKLQTLPQPLTTFGTGCFGTASEWRFAEHQYDAIGASVPGGERTYSYNSLQNPAVGDWIDLFAWMGNDASNTTVIGWPAEYKYGIIYTNSNGPGKYVGNVATEGVLVSLWYDWGHNDINYGDFTYEPDTWRVLTKEEYRALINWRCYGDSGEDYLTTSAVKARIVVSNEKQVNGLIIFPDYFTAPYGITITKAHVCGYTGTAGNVWNDDKTANCADNIFTLEQWQKLEDAGCAFLPFTNIRSWDATNKINITNYPGDGLYWSSTRHVKKTAILCLAFNDINTGASLYSASANNLTVSYQGTRQLGYGVRLVRDVK